jgi:hypothetical protein
LIQKAYLGNVEEIPDVCPRNPRRRSGGDQLRVQLFELLPLAGHQSKMSQITPLSDGIMLAVGSVYTPDAYPFPPMKCM